MAGCHYGETGVVYFGVNVDGCSVNYIVGATVYYYALDIGECFKLLGGNVPEPLSKEVPVSPAEMECVLLPLLGFDRQGNRIGYGAGYYDRFLVQNPHLKKIGLAYACQEVDAVPTEENDIPLDMVITENGIREF